MLATRLGFLALLPQELLAPPPTAIDVARGLIRKSEEDELRVAVPGGEEQVTKFRAQEDREGNTWSGWRIIPYIIPIAIPADGKGKGQVTLTLEFPGRKDPIVLRSRGLAEDVYLLRHLVPETDKAAAKWLEKVAPDSKIVAAWPEQEPKAAGKDLEKLPPELAAAVKLGKDAYEAKRPELIRRFNKSFLFYPAPETKDWKVTADKDALWLETGCHDQMYFARLRVEMRKTDKGAWEVIRVLAGEFFKGE